MTLLIIFLAAYRLTHLVVFDKIFEPIRNLFVRRYYVKYSDGLVVRYELQGGEIRQFVGKIMNCFWCAGIWVSALTTSLWIHDLVSWFLITLASATVVGFLGTWWTKYVGFPEMEPMGREEA